MLAEFHGKLSAESTQDFERLEDLLTDYVFGTLSYLPRLTGLRAFLDSVLPDVTFSDQDIENAVFSFWPTYERTEPDVVIRVGRRMVVIEAKLWSGFGQGATQADDQLVREYSAAMKASKMSRLDEPFVIAVTPGFSQPDEIDKASQFIGADDESHPNPVRWINWQSIGSIFEELQPQLQPNEMDLVRDTLAIMERRGVRRMFDGFAEEDYWLMAAAQRRAADVVYPTISTFCDQLRTELADRGISPGSSENRIITHQSFSFGQPEKWGASFLYLPFVSDDWIVADHWRAGLFVQFSLREPRVSVGYRHHIRTKDRKRWSAQTKQLTEAFRGLADHTLGSVRYPDYDKVLDLISAPSVDERWVNVVIDRSDSRLVMYRDLPLSALVTTDVVSDMIDEDRRIVDSIPFLIEEMQT